MKGHKCALPFALDPEMFAEQRKRLASSLKSAEGGVTAAALLRGAAEIPRNYTDTSYVFRQDSYFFYLFGIDLPDCMGAVLSDGTGILFLPRLPESYAIWMGPLPTPEGIASLMPGLQAAYVDEIPDVFERNKVQIVHVLKGTNTDSGLQVPTAQFDKEKEFRIVDDFLFETLSNQRVLKTSREVEVFKYVSKVSSDAHVKVMQTVVPGMSQHQAEATFLHECYFHGGCRQVCYNCICVSGPSCAILHSPYNNQPMEDGTMCLMDMGAEYQCYGSDITCSYPVNGKFSAEQQWVYEAVLNANRAVLSSVRPGISWVEMHKLALRSMSRDLLDHGVLCGLTVEEIENKGIMYYFQPHGLGHLLGLDAHDVGGYPTNGISRPASQLCSRLRTARTLEEGIYLTVEPGLYFNPALLEKCLADPELSQYFDADVVKPLMKFGGVRIEDNIIITADGCLDLTCVPRDVIAIEGVMAKKLEWHWETKQYHNSK